VTALLTLGLVVLLVSPAAAGDRQQLEHVPTSCRHLDYWKERCRLGPCNTKQIEHWRERCKADSIHG
jgi:hypothetical protein